jgi:cytochrome c oxidase assembly factor CtaG
MAEFRSNNSVVENNEASIEAGHSNGFKPEWYHWAMAILGFFPAFMFWKAIIQKNDIPWKEVIIGSLLYCLCYIPGIIYCIKWMKREF